MREEKSTFLHAFVKMSISLKQKRFLLLSLKCIFTVQFFMLKVFVTAVFSWSSQISQYQK